MTIIKIGGKEYPIRCTMLNQHRIYEKYPDLAKTSEFNTKQNLDFYADLYFEVLQGQFSSIEEMLGAMSPEEYQASYATVLEVFWGNAEKKTPATST